jgi:hypothetical protein
MCSLDRSGEWNATPNMPIPFRHSVWRSSRGTASFRRLAALLLLLLLLLIFIITAVENHHCVVGCFVVWFVLTAGTYGSFRCEGTNPKYWLIRFNNRHLI